MKRDIELLYELGAIRLIPRQWSRFHLQNVANLAEHHFRTVWLALLISAREGVGNTEKIMKMAIVHDIAESRTGDVDYLARQYVERHEDRALNDMLAGTPFQKEFFILWQEYEARETIEAKIVKDADNLDVDLEMREQAAAGNKIGDEWKPQRDHVREHKLYTQTAKKLQQEIWASNPNDWHKESPNNRLNAGDWVVK